MSEKKPTKRQVHWWPALWPPLEESCLSEFYMSVLVLFLTYFLFFIALWSEKRLFSIGILALYFIQVPLYVGISEDLTRAEKWQSFVQQMSVSFLLTSPLLWVLWAQRS